MNLTECKYCGLHATWHIDDDTFFACGTSWCGRVDVWNQSTGCVEIMQSRRRIKRAVEVLEGANQIMMTLDDDDEEVSFVVESQTVSHAIEILGGEEDDEAD